jgi:DNA anti-recombination protein RmuC
MKKPIALVIDELQETRNRLYDKIRKLKDDKSEGITEVHQTNEDIFLDMIEQEDSMVVAMARTMLTTQASEVLKNKETVIKAQKNGLISGEYIIYCAKKILERFDKE